MKIKKIKIILGMAMLLLLSSCSQNPSTQAKRKDIIDAVFASGYLITDDEYLVTAKAEGYLSSTLVEEGDTVTKGMPLFFLSNEVPSAQLANAQANYVDAQRKLNTSSPQIQQLEAQIAQAKAQAHSDEVNYQRFAKLVKTQAVSQVDFEKVKLQFEASESNIAILEKSLDDLKQSLALGLNNAQTQLVIQQETSQDYVLASAIQGQVLSVLKKTGELIRRGEAIAKIGGGEILIKLFIAEEDIQRIALGQKALVSLNTNKERPYEARVTKIYPAFDMTEQSFIVEASFEKLPKTLFANTQLQANIIVAEKKDALIIPTMYLSENNTVFLANQGELLVKVGIQNNEWTEILEGLSESQTIVLNPKP